MLAGHLALVAAALFTGAALYISVAEQPARLGLDDAALLRQWRAAYERGTRMQAPLAVLCFLLAAAAWWSTGRGGWLAGGLLLLGNLPLTLIVILPTNRCLMRTMPAEAGPESRTLIERWGRLHAGRTVLGIAGTLALLWASLA